MRVATQNGLEPSTSSVTGWRSNQLNYWATNTRIVYIYFRHLSILFLINCYVFSEVLQVGVFCVKLVKISYEPLPRREDKILRRIISVFLLVAMLVMILSFSAAAADITFIAINDKLLNLDTTPYFYGSAFVPYDVFTEFNSDNIGFQVNTTFFQSDNTISLYTSDKQLYYNMNTGAVYDHNDTNYYTPAVIRNGELYVSVQFVSNFFGLNWTQIKGDDYGDVLRITDGNHYLSDGEFLAAAESLMKSRYEAYMGTQSTSTPEILPTPSPSPSPEPDEDEDEGIGGIIYLSFEGLPSHSILRTLENYSARATFYLSADDISQNPDIVREIYGKGHALGVYCSENAQEDFLTTSEIMYEAVAFSPLTLSSSGANLQNASEFADEFEYKFHNYDIYAVSGLTAQQVIDRLEEPSETTSLRLGASDEYASFLNSLLYFLAANEFELLLEREF